MQVAGLLLDSAMRFTRVLPASLLLAAGASLGQTRPLVLTVADTQGAAARTAAPLSARVDLSRHPGTGQLRLIPVTEGGHSSGEPVTVQFEPDGPASPQGTASWLMPPGEAGPRRFVLAWTAPPDPTVMEVRSNPATGRWDISELGKPVLGYNYQTNEPGAVLAQIHPDNQKYARPRSDYIHPLHGPDGEVLTQDWSLDHPHHRGIYWAWPEVDYRGERGDLHALQRVFARPTGLCRGQGGPVFAQIEAENLWRWEDREPIVRERVMIRAWRAGPMGRCIDLEFHFTALKEEVAIARRDTRLYGGLNIRLAPVREQEILFHTDPAEVRPRRAWALLSGLFPGGRQPAGLAVFQNPANPGFPGDWVKYPEIHWFQPTFPAAGTRHVLKPNQPLVLRYRLWVRAGVASEAELIAAGSAYADSPVVTLGD